MTFWDIAAGILIAAFLISAVAYGWRRGGPQGVGTMAMILAAAIVLWRANCWYGTISCDSHLQALTFTAHQ